MRKTSILFCLLVMLFSSAFADPAFDLEQMRGSWWSSLDNTTSDFSLRGDKVWFEIDDQHYPCRIEGDILIFDFGPQEGELKQRIVSFEGDRLVLEYLDTKKRRVLTRVRH